MAFKTRKPKQQFRKKSSSALEDGGENQEQAINTSIDAPASDQSAPSTPKPPPAPTVPEASTPSTPGTPVNGNKEKTPATTPTSSGKPKQATLLSFEEEEAEEEFTEKKSSRSKRMSKQVKESKVRPLQRNLPVIESTATAALSTGPGEYTPERLAELKRNAVSFRPSPSASSSSDNPFGVDPALPTAEQIHAARERRAKMREGGSSAKDFIPLNEGKGEGRLVREDGEDDDEDEEGRDGNSRIDFNSVKGKGDRGKAQMEEAIDVDAQDEDDEEMKRWEMDRIRKGVGAQEMKRKDLVEKAKKPGKPTPGGPAHNIHLDLTRETKPTITLESITKDINVTLAGLQTAHKSHVVQLERINEELERASTQTVALKEEAKSGADEYSFFAGMKDYVSDLLDCLGAKAEMVENAEDKLIAAHRVHGARNRTYAQNQIDEKTAEMKSIGEEAAGYAKPTQTKVNDVKEKRKRARGEEEGWSSDEESEEVNKEFEQAKIEAREEGKAVFADVNEDYSSLSTIKERFEKWKNDYPNSYKQAYISLSMPQLFSPFVRLQLLDRDLLSKDSLDAMGWFNNLFEYGRGEGGTGLDDPEDEDNFLVPKLVEKVVVPRLMDGLTHEWNVQSKRGNNLALRRVSEVLDYAESQEADHVKELVSSVYGGLQQAVAEVNIPIFPLPKESGENDDRQKEPWEFSCRLFWRAVKLLRNIAAWHSVIATKPLQQLIIDNLLTQKLLPFLRSIRESHPSLFLDAYESILDSLPPTWLVNESGKGVSPSFGLFHDQVLRVAKQLEKEKKDTEREKQLARAVRILSRLQDQETARTIAKLNSIKL